jgi:hypothetical protein
MDPLVQISRPNHYRRARRFWSPLSAFGPFSAIAAALVHDGRRLNGMNFYGPGDELAIDVMDLSRLLPMDVTVQHAKVSSRRVTLSAATALCNARDIEAPVVNAPKGTTPPKRRVHETKPMSRRAALRYAKEAQAKHDAAEQLRAVGGVPTVVLAEVPELSTEVASAIEDFIPNLFPLEDWVLVGDATRTLAALYDPPSARWVELRMGAIARFCQWVLQRPEREDATNAVRAEEAVAPGLVDEYIAGPLATRSDGTRSTTRSVLRGSRRRFAAHRRAPGAAAVHAVRVRVFLSSRAEPTNASNSARALCSNCARTRRGTVGARTTNDHT